MKEIDQKTQERFWTKVEKTDTCWLWTGSVRSNGYGNFHHDEDSLPHRISYTLAKGPIQEGAVIDHVCRVKRCVNPDHLDAVTQQENMLRAQLTPEEHMALLVPSPSQAKEPRGETRLAIWAGVVIAVITLVGFGLSYAHLAQVARAHGLPDIRAWMWPMTLDLFIISGEVLMLRAALQRRKDWWAVLLTVSGSVGSIGLNVAGVSGRDVLAYVVAGVPPTASLVAFGALMSQLHRSMTKHETLAPAKHLTEEHDPVPATARVTETEQHPEPKAQRAKATTQRPKDYDPQVYEAWLTGRGVRATATELGVSPSTISRAFRALDETHKTQGETQ